MLAISKSSNRIGVQRRPAKCARYSAAPRVPGPTPSARRGRLRPPRFQSGSRCSTINETQWQKSPNADITKKLVAESLTTPSNNAGKLTEIWAQLQKQQFDQGGTINYGTYDYINAVSAKVGGLTPSKYLFASGCNLRKAWLAS
jgi:hypothetical protein